MRRSIASTRAMPAYGTIAGRCARRRDRTDDRVRGVFGEGPTDRGALRRDVLPFLLRVVGPVVVPRLRSTDQHRRKPREQATLAHVAQDPEDLDGARHFLGGLHEGNAAAVRLVGPDPAGLQQPRQDLQVAAPDRPFDHGGEQRGAQRVGRGGVQLTAATEVHHDRSTVVADDAEAEEVCQEIGVVGIAEERLGVGP